MPRGSFSRWLHLLSAGFFLVMMTGVTPRITAERPVSSLLSVLLKQSQVISSEILSSKLIPFLTSRGLTIWHVLMTPTPAVQEIFPPEGTRFIPTFTAIRVEWNTPVDAASFFEHLQVTPDLPKEEARNLKVEWDYEKEPRVLMVSMQPHFPENTAVTIRILPGVKSLHTLSVSTREFTSTFFTMNPLTFNWKNLFLSLLPPQ